MKTKNKIIKKCVNCEQVFPAKNDAQHCCCQECYEAYFTEVIPVRKTDLISVKGVC